MSVQSLSPEVEIRDSRLNSILVYNGNTADLYEKSRSRELGCENCSFSQTGECSQATGQHEIMHIKEVAVISHAPIGCAGSFFVRNVENWIKDENGENKMDPVKAFSSNMTEKDTIYGGGEKLYATILETYKRYHSKAIVVSTSCACAIVGDDVEGVLEQAEKEIGIPVVGVHCEGFRSKIWATGFDTTYHAMLRKLIKPPEQKQPDRINIFTFHGDKQFINQLISQLGITANYYMFHSSLEEIAKMSEAAGSTQICRTLSTYITKALEDEYGVPEIKSPVPFGIRWTDEWLREIARVTHKEHLVEDVIRSEHEKMAPELESLRKQLRGKRVYVLAGDTFAHHLMAIGKDLGMKIVGAATYHHDLSFDDNDEKLDSLHNLKKHYGDFEDYTVCNKQPYQLLRLIKATGPDLLIARHPGIAVVGIKLGIPTFYAGDPNTELGYHGVLEVGRRIVQSLQTRKLVENIAKHVVFPYTAWWQESDPFVFAGGTENE